jgi:hypothetical protein
MPGYQKPAIVGAEIERGHDFAGPGGARKHRLRSLRRTGKARNHRINSIDPGRRRRAWPPGLPRSRRPLSRLDRSSADPTRNLP